MGRHKGTRPVEEGEKLNSRNHIINIQKTKEYNKKWGKEHPKRHSRYPFQYHKYHLSRYGLTPEDYNDMFLKQNGCCAICGTHQNNFKRKLSVDHDHETGIVRGLLCMRCNLILGYAKDDTALLKRSIQYLKNK